jgi:DNA-binding response OmpR family regulator
MGFKIMIADDDMFLVRVVMGMLKSHGYWVVTASDAIQANMVARREKPDLILLDFRMPAGDGLKVYENLQKASEVGSVPVVFMSADTSEELKAKAMALGAVDFLNKPFDEAKLIATVKKALGETPPEQSGAGSQSPG